MKERLQRFAAAHKWLVIVLTVLLVCAPIMQAAQISRLKDAEIQNGNIAEADDVAAELDQLVSAFNANDTILSNIASGVATISGVKTFSSNIKVNGIDERTAASGVTIDSVLLKDGFIRAVGTTQPFAPATNGDFGYDSTNHQYKGYRNGTAKSFLMTGDAASVAAVTARSSNTILGAADNGKMFVATSTFTQTVDAAATLTAGWYVYYRNDGTGIITFDFNGSETGDGGTTITLMPGEGFTLVCDGTNFKTVGRIPAGSWILVETLSPSGVSSVDSTLGYLTGYDHKFEIDNLDTASDNVGLDMRISLDGSTFRSSAGDYQWSQGIATSGASGVTNASDTELTLFDTGAGFSLGDAAGEPPHQLTVTLTRPDTSDAKKPVVTDGFMVRASDGAVNRVMGAGAFKGTTGAILGVRILSTANFSATIHHYVKRRLNSAFVQLDDFRRPKRYMMAA